MFSSGTVSKETSILFVGLAALFVHFQRKIDRKTENDEAQSTKELQVTDRGAAAMRPAQPYIADFFRCLEDPCDAINNPNGHIALCVAENKLVTDLIAERMMQPTVSSVGFSHEEVYVYNSFLGLPIAREALAYFLAKRFLLPDQPGLTKEVALQHVSPQDVAFGAGCAALLNYLFYILGSYGDACLMPAPLYAAVANDMKIIAGCVPISVQIANPSIGPTPEELDLAFLSAQSKGHRVKFLFLTNPHNPLGIIYRPNVVKKAIQWARKRKMHTIVDEIYALSTHSARTQFESVLRVLDNKLENDVHMLWGLSKDFGASGFRVGCIYSQNKSFIASLANLNYFSGVSQPMQIITADLLTDDAFVDSFLETSRERLRQSYQICTRKLEEMVVPFIPAEAGLFVYVDFSSLLPEKTFEGELQFSEVVMKYARVVLTPGQSQHDRSPGMYRLCFAWVPPEVLQIAMERLSKLVAKIRRMDWSDLKDSTLQSVLA